MRLRCCHSRRCASGAPRRNSLTCDLGLRRDSLGRYIFCTAVVGIAGRHLRLDTETIRDGGVASIVRRVVILGDRGFRLSLHVDAALTAYSRMRHLRSADGQEYAARLTKGARRFPAVARVLRQCAARRPAAKLRAAHLLLCPPRRPIWQILPRLHCLLLCVIGQRASSACPLGNLANMSPQLCCEGYAALARRSSGALQTSAKGDGVLSHALKTRFCNVTCLARVAGSDRQHPAAPRGCRRRSPSSPMCFCSALARARASSSFSCSAARRARCPGRLGGSRGRPQRSSRWRRAATVFALASASAC